MTSQNIAGPTRTLVRLLEAFRFGTYVAGVARRSQGMRVFVTGAGTTFLTSDSNWTQELPAHPLLRPASCWGPSFEQELEGTFGTTSLFHLVPLADLPPRQVCGARPQVVHRGIWHWYITCPRFSRNLSKLHVCQTDEVGKMVVLSSSAPGLSDVRASRKSHPRVAFPVGLSCVQQGTEFRQI